MTSLPSPSSPGPARRTRRRGLALLLGLLGAAPTAAQGAGAAGTAVWLGATPDPTQVQASTHLTAEQAAPQGTWTDRDSAAVAALRDELTAVVPLLDVFDGELQVLRRLEAAIAQVRDLRAEDRALLHDARAFQGLAAERYFQDGLATAPAAEPWRMLVPDGMGGTRVVNRLYVDAVAVDPDTLPSAEVVPDDEARLSYQEVRAAILVAPDATVSVGDLPEGGLLVVDGVASATDRARVVPGEHRVRIEVAGQVRLQQVVRLEPGQVLQLASPADAAELESLGRSLDGTLAVPLPPRVRTTLDALEAPVTLVVAGRGGPLAYRVADGAAIPLAPEPGASTRSPRRDRGLSFSADLAAAWIYDGEWYLLNAGEGAPGETATVNGLAPGLHLAVQQRLGLLALGAGVDGAATLGQWQDLRVGTDDWRLRLYPHASVGLPWAWLTVGAWLPWRVGVGARGAVPLVGPLQLTGGALLGLGPTYQDAAGASYTPTTAVSAWGGLGVRLGD